MQRGQSEFRLPEANRRKPFISVEIPQLDAAGSFDRDTLFVSYQVKLSEPIGQGLGIIASQGFVESAELPAVASQDPERSVLGVGTETYIDSLPRIEVLKRDFLLLDRNRDRLLSTPFDDGPQERLLYQLTLHNLGNVRAASVVLEDILPERVRLIPDSVRTDRGAIVVGATADSRNVLVEIGPMNRRQVTGASEAANISFEVELIEGAPPAQIENVAKTLILLGTNDPDLDAQYEVRSDDPDTVERGDATITPVTQLPTKLEIADEAIIDAKPDETPSLDEPAIYLPLLTNP